MSNDFDVIAFIDEVLEQADTDRKRLLTEIESARKTDVVGRDTTQNLRKSATDLTNAVQDLQALRMQFADRLAIEKAESEGSWLGLYRKMIANPEHYRAIEKRCIKVAMGAQLTEQTWRAPWVYENNEVDSVFLAAPGGN